MENIKVSFIVAVYNIEKYIRECISSICKIRRKDIEIILINDGSTDDSLRICTEFAELDNRIVIINQNNQGLAMARNVGIGKARGEWLTFIDGDDCLTEKFETDILERIDDNFDIIYFGYKHLIDGQFQKQWEGEDYYLDSDVIETLRLSTLNRDYQKFKNIKDENFLYTSSCSKLFKKKLLEENALDFVQDVSWGEDVLFTFKTLKYVQQIKMIAHTGYYYRINSNSMTQKYDNEIFNKYLAFMNAFVVEVQKEQALIYSQMLWNMIVKQYLTIVRRDIFNKDNPCELKKRKECFLQTRREELVTEGFEKADFKQFNFIIRVGAILGKYNMFYCLNFLYKIQRAKEQINFKRIMK